MESLTAITVGQSATNPQGYVTPVGLSQETIQMIQRMLNAPPFTPPPGALASSRGGRRLTEAEKAQRRSRFDHIDSKEKAQVWANRLYEYYLVLLRLEKILDKNPGKRIQYTDDPRAFTGRAEQDRYLAAYKREIRGVKTVLTTSRGRRRKTAPEEFKGVWSVIVAGDALRTFIERADLGTDSGAPSAPTQGATGARLQDRLSAVARNNGVYQRNTLRNLLDINRAVEDLSGVRANSEAEARTGQASGTSRSLVRASQAMMDAFGGTIPAGFALAVTGTEARRSKRTGQALPTKTITSKVPNTGGLNTFDVIRAVRPDFNPNSFGLVFFTSIIGVNSLPLAETYIQQSQEQIAQAAATGQACPAPITPEQAAIQAVSFITENRDAILGDTQLVNAVKASWKASNAAANELHSRLTSKARPSRSKRSSRSHSLSALHTQAI